ncbi:hypothetical protein [Streptomyces sp. NPDC094149]|uniref:hypothetical protein n=1 Tax=Streptomyces sp. NPDC094149 TaxID=3155079 RepID=UPI003334363D
MRIKAVMAATVLSAALVATGATTAAAVPHAGRGGHDDEAVCSPYAGSLTALGDHIDWIGTHCSDYLR